MFLCAHLAGCGYAFLSYFEQCPTASEWVLPEYIRASSLLVQYIHSCYWGFAAMVCTASSSLLAPRADVSACTWLMWLWFV